MKINIKKINYKLVKLSIIFAFIFIMVATVSAQSDSSESSGMPIWLQAGLWGAFAGAASLLGAIIGYAVKTSKESNRSNHGFWCRSSDFGFEF